MICEKCGMELEDNAKFCTGCGQSVDEAVQAPAAPPATGIALPKLKTKMALSDIITLAVGTLLVVVGFILLLSSGGTVNSTSFGGDFYTYTYQGIVVIVEVLSKLNAAVAWLVIGLGAYIDLRVLNRKEK